MHEDPDEAAKLGGSGTQSECVGDVVGGRHHCPLLAVDVAVESDVRETFR